MLRNTRFGLEFVENMPSTLEPATLYVSIRYRVTAHLCMCGCGEKVVNPLRPDRWALSYDGEAVSLSPSVGNSGLPCKSHYWLTHNAVRWLPPMTVEQSERAFQADGWMPDSRSERTQADQPVSGLWRRVWRSVMARRRT